MDSEKEWGKGMEVLMSSFGGREEDVVEQYLGQVGNQPTYERLDEWRLRFVLWDSADQ